MTHGVTHGVTHGARHVAGTGWRMAQPFLLRSAGFPAATMAGITMPGAASATDAALAAEDACTQLAAELTLQLRPAFATRRDSGLRWKTVHKALQAGRAFTPEELACCADAAALQGALQAWNAAVAAAQQAEALAAQRFDAELLASRAALHVQFGQARVAEAVFLSSPHLHATALPRYAAEPPGTLRPSDRKRLERQLTMYLQRLCTKNETTSFFGPIGYGRVDNGPRAPADPGTWPLHWQQRPLGRRHAFMAHWAVQALADRLAAVPAVRARLQPRWRPGLQRRGRDTLVSAVQDRAWALPPACADLLDDVDRGLDVRALVQRHGEATLVALEQRGVLRTGVPLAIGETQALEALVDWLHRHAECENEGEGDSVAPWRAGLAHLLALKQSFAAAGMDRRPALLAQAERAFEGLAGQPAQRDAGKIYADRSLFYEECVSGHEQLRADPAWAQQVQARLGALLDLFARHALLQREALAALGGRIFTQLFGAERRSVPFLHFAERLTGSPLAAGWAAEAAQWRSPVQEAMHCALQALATAGRREVELPSAWLEAATWPGPLHSEQPLLASPDLMIVRQPDGQPLLVLGEVHDTLMLWGWALAFAEDAPALQAEMEGFASALDLRHVLNIVGGRRRKIVPFEYPGASVELRSGCGLRNPAVPAADLEVRLEDGRARLYRAGDATPKVLHNGELASLAHALFALPRCVPFSLDLGAHTPRVVLGGVVLQRERWRLERSEAGLANDYPGTSFALFRDMRRLRQRLAMPERVFFKSPAEPKPVFIDFRSHLLLEALDALWPPGTPGTFSEMLPDTDQLWLTDGNGQALTAELRLGFGRPPDAPPVATPTPQPGAFACRS